MAAVIVASSVGSGAIVDMNQSLIWGRGALI
jgi:hypothetical protein